MTGITRRRVLSGAVAASAIGGKAACAAADPRLADLYAKAKAERELTWYIAQVSSEEAEQMGAMFSGSYPGVKVNVVRATGQVIYQKLSQDMRASARNCDVFSSTDLGQYVALGRRNLLLQYTPVLDDTLRPLFRDYDKAHLYQVTNDNFTTLVYHSGKVNAAAAPRKWTDLIDAKWENQVAVAHPAYSGAMGTWVYLIDKMYGWQFFENLAKIKPLVGRSLIDPVTTIASGERVVGLGPSDLILEQAARNNPVAIAYPEDGSILTVGPTSILRDAPHPNAAALFVEWLLGAESARYAAMRHRLPISAEVAPLPGVKVPDEIKIITPDADALEKGIPTIIEKWRDTFGV